MYFLTQRVDSSLYWSTEEKLTVILITDCLFKSSIKYKCQMFFDSGVFCISISYHFNWTYLGFDYQFWYPWNLNNTTVMLMYILPLCGKTLFKNGHEQILGHPWPFFKAPNFRNYCCGVFKVSTKIIRSIRSHNVIVLKYITSNLEHVKIFLGSSEERAELSVIWNRSRLVQRLKATYCRYEMTVQRSRLQATTRNYSLPNLSLQICVQQGGAAALQYFSSQILLSEKKCSVFLQQWH